MFIDLIKLHNLRQKQIAMPLKVTPQLVNKWCSNKCEPSLNAIIKLSRHFNIPIEEIVLSFEKKENELEKTF